MITTTPRRRKPFGCWPFCNTKRKSIFSRIHFISWNNYLWWLQECLVNELRLGKRCVFYLNFIDQTISKFGNFCSNLNLLLSNISYLNHVSSVTTGVLNARSSTWWVLDIESAKWCEIKSWNSTAGYSQLIEQLVHTTNDQSSCSDLIFAVNPNCICALGVELSLLKKRHPFLV